MTTHVANPIPVTILTGFLGAGKTTLLNALLRDEAFTETAVLINEFGNVQIDHDLVAEFSDDLVTTTTGCLCCEASSDLRQSLFDLWMRRKDRKIGPFRRVIVETTGLLDPAPVVNALLAPPSASLIDRIVTGQFALSRVVTLYDVVNGLSTLDQSLEALKQIALADIVVFTKTDISGDLIVRETVEADRATIARFNPAARIMDRHADWPELRSTFLQSDTYDLRTKGEDAIGWLKAEQVLAAQSDRHVHADRTRHGDDIQSHVIVIDDPISPLIFYFFLDALKMSVGPDLLRLKGLFALSDDPDRPVVVHGVQHLIHPIDKLDRWPSDDRRTRIVVIGRNLNVEAMRGILTSTRPKQHSARAELAKAAVIGGLLVVGVAASATWLAAEATGKATSEPPLSINQRSIP